MYEQDFLMRQIKQFLDVLEIVVNKKKERNINDVLKIIDQTLDSLIETKGLNFNDLTLDRTLSVLNNSNKFNSELAVIVSELLHEKTELISNKDEKKTLLKQAYILNKKALKDPSIAFPLESFDKMKHIEDYLSDEEMKSITQALYKSYKF